MPASPDLYHKYRSLPSVNEPAQPHQQQSIIVGESSKKFELGIAAINQNILNVRNL